MRINNEEYESLLKKRGIRTTSAPPIRKVKKPTKYGNQPCECDGKRFDSKFEAAYYRKLKQQEAAGIIRDLRLQVPFELQPPFEHQGKKYRAIKYVADFTYKDSDDILHIIDTKGFETETYKLKKKMMLYHGHHIEEVRKKKRWKTGK